MNEPVVVRTKEELAAEVEAGTEEIVVEGELAKRIKDGRKLGKVGRWRLTVLAAAVAALPFTGGLSGVVAVPVAAATGLGTVVILAVIFVGLTLLLAVYRGYDVTIDFPNGIPPRPRIKLKKKK